MKKKSSERRKKSPVQKLDKDKKWPEDLLSRQTLEVPLDAGARIRIPPSTDGRSIHFDLSFDPEREPANVLPFDFDKSE